MALEPITRQEKIIAGQDLTPITRMEMFLKQFGGGGGGLPSGGAPYQHLVTDGDGNAKWEDRLAYETDPVLTEIIPQTTVAFTENSGLMGATWPENFDLVDGKTYTISWDGTDYVCTGILFNGAAPVLGNLGIMGVGDDTGEPFIFFNEGQWAVFSTESATEHIIGIRGFAREVVKIDEKYLPESIATKSEVEVAQTTAENAQTTAENAQSTVNNAKNMASSNKEVLYSALGSTVTFTFDKQTSGRDTFVFNQYNYYKVSDFTPAQEDVISFKGTRESGLEFSRIKIGNNCVEYGLFIVVSSAGVCSLPVTDTVTYSFTAPSAGLYAMYKEGNTDMTAGTGEFTLQGSTGSLSITGLLLKSSTSGSAKKFKITVDDSGTISATEVLA